MQRLFPTSQRCPDHAAIYDDLAFPVPADRPYVFANMVASVDGKAQLDGSARGLGSAVDSALLVRLRAPADAVLIGAGTLRSEKVYGRLPPELAARRLAKGMAPQPRWVIASRSGDVPLDSALFRKPEEPALVITADATLGDRISAAGGRAELLLTGAGSSLAPAIGALRGRYGVRYLLTEGGPGLLRALLGEALIDELFLTVAPKLVGGESMTIVAGPLLKHSALTLVSLFEHESELFLRYRVNGNRGTASAIGHRMATDQPGVCNTPLRGGSSR